MNGTRAWVAVLASAALLSGVGLPAAADAPAGSTSEARVPEIAVESSSLPPGVGVTVGGTNTVAADVLGLGYEQVVRLNGSRVEVVEPVTRGSAVLRSFEAGASHAWPTGLFGPVFYGGINMANRVGQGASRLAVAGEHIYVSNLRTRQAEAAPPDVRVPDGSVTTKYSVDGVVLNQRVEKPDYAVTALAGIEWRGKEYLAIGLNQSGVRIVDDTVQEMPDVHALMLHYSGPLRSGSVRSINERDQITQLRFGPVGDKLMLAVGVLTGDMPALLAFDAVTGAELWAKNLRPNDPAKFEWPQEIEFGPFGAGGRTELAVGWPTLGRLSFLEAVDGGDRGQIDGGVVGAIRFFTDASGEARVGYGHGLGNQWSAHVAKRDTAGNVVVIDSGPVGDLPWMVPGYRPWSIQIDNRTRTNLSSRAFAGSTRAEGCWYGADLRTASDPLPVQPVPVAMGGRSGAFMTGQRLRGASCGDNPGVFYIHVEPAGAPGQRQVVQLRGTASGIEVVDQVGAGRFTVHTEREGASVRVVVSERHDPPSVVSAPVLEAARLTPAPAAQHVPTDDVNDPSRPVHRFTLSGVSWNVPGAASDLTEATLPLPTAEGSVDGESWDSLGTVAAPTAPTRDGDRVTMGTAVFDWQTSAGATKDYRYFRVNAEGSASNVIDTAGLSSPAPAPTVSKLQITGTASPRANGLDQTPLRISLFGDGSQALDTVQHASWYERVYFRDPTTKALITGLGDPANPSQLMIFSLQAGQYANDGVTAAGASMAAYFSTRTSQQARSVMAVLKLEGTVDSKSLRSATSSFRAESKSLLGEGTGANGLVVTPCAEGVCTLADPQVGPALHSLTGTSVSVQFRTRVIPGAGSLPLTQPERNGEDLRLVSDHLTIRGSRATLSNPNVFGTGTMIATNLVTHGDRLTLENHYAK